MAVAPSETTGTFFLLPPHHRLFVVFDDPGRGSEVANELRDEGGADDVWTFFGEEGVRALDPRIGHHGVPVAVVRVFQHAMTNDCEYCNGLVAALRRGASVLAVRAEHDQVDDLSERLRRKGGHTFAYGEHWNFVPLQGAEHTVAFFPTDVPTDGPTDLHPPMRSGRGADGHAGAAPGDRSATA